MDEVDKALPDAIDKRFSELVLNYLAGRNIIVSEGAGAHPILDLLAVPQEVRGKTILIYADTADVAWGFAKLLRTCQLDQFHLEPSILAALLKLKSVLEENPNTLQLYLTGSSWFVDLAVELAKDFGLRPEQISAERAASGVRRLTCCNCRSAASYRIDGSISCISCGTPLFATYFFCCDSNSFWGSATE